jgi:lipopolysaccharide export system protein LptC
VTGLSTTSTLERMEDRGFDVGAQRDGERAFRRAMRHSRWVRVLRRTIPVIVVLILGATMLVRWLDPLRVLARLPGSVEGLVLSGTKITMAVPRLSGFTNDSRRYELTARSAVQDITKPNLVELSAVDAKVDVGDEGTVQVTAADGIYDRSSGILTLRRDVKFKATNGSEVRLDEAVINTGTGEMLSEKPVEVHTQQGTVRADRFEVDNSGEVIRFIGGVIMKLPGSSADANQQLADKP